MAKKPSVSVVIPCWNSLDQLKQNLPSVFEAARQVNAEIIVVDDASQLDTSVSYLESLGPKIMLVKNQSNLGFGATVNKGVEKASGDLVVLLNTDVRPESDCFIKALEYFDDDTVYAVGFNSGESWMGGEWKRGLFHHFKAESKNSQNTLQPSLWASGGQAMFSRAKWMELGGMDTMYQPFYWEDTDMGYRAWKRGWSILWAKECRVVHDHRKSVIANNYSKEFVLGSAQRNQFLFIWKNISDSSMLLTHLLYLPLYFLRYPRTLLSALVLSPQAIKSRFKESLFWKRSDQAILIPWKR